MEEEDAKFLANVLILYFMFDVSAEDIRDEEVRKKCIDLLATDLEPFNFLGISKAQQKLVDIILKK